MDTGIATASLGENLSESGRRVISFDNSGIATFTQGQDPTCVAASTVMARLTADPVLMLAVTTGQGSASAAAEPNPAMKARPRSQPSQTLFNQDYAYGRAAQGDDAKEFLGITYQAAAPPGLGSTGVIAVADQQLTPVTGSAYRYQPLTDTAERQAAVPKIEAAVDAGEPVPVDVRSSSGGAGHQMVIEDYQDGEFEFYQPWGLTQWASTQQFVDGQLGALTDNSDGRASGGLPDPAGGALPQQ